jgi:AcrR family transcriptional regulator/DNA-binding MarR family transcriptional regulator
MSSGRRAPSKPVAPAQIEPGRNGLAKERVADIQRARLLAAMVEIAAEQGLTGATVAQVVARAGVSRRTFYELFEDREGCYLAAMDDAIARASDCVLPAYHSGDGWAERLRLALTALLCFLDVERDAGRLLIVGSLGAGANALERRRRVLAQIITAIDRGRSEVKGGSDLPPLTAEGVVGGALSVIHARLIACPPPGSPRSGEPGPARGACPRMEELTGPLMGTIVLPYLGPAAARKELARPAPRAHAADRRGVGDPLRELGMRLTYRTVRVLFSVADTPGASNRQIGVAAGIADQGQISKLLSRLERLGLVRNNGLAPGKGAPNAWTLTEKGAEVERAMGAEMSGGDRR